VEPRFDRRLRHAFALDVADARLPVGPGDRRPVTDADLEHLDEPVQRYFRFMGVLGAPRTWSFTVCFAGRFRLRRDGPWMPASGIQYNSAIEVARVFTMRLRMFGFLPMLGHDTYLRGRGGMHGKMVGLVPVADGSGPEFDLGELSTWLNDAVMLAPSMLLHDTVSWRAIDDHTLEVGLEDSGHRVQAEVAVDERGAPTDYVTTDRWAAMPEGNVRATWRTPVPGWDESDGRPFPAPGSATWDLPDGPFTYVEGGFLPDTLRTNVPPPSPHPRSGRSYSAM
jgi:hypothetical protein